MPNSPHFTVYPQPLDWHDLTSFTAVSDPLLSHHEIEQAVWRELQNAPHIHFSSLTVRRVRDGVCLQGVMEFEDDQANRDVCDLVRRVAHVQNVVNQLLVREPARSPARVPR
jgi:hypothetical protein